MSAFDLSHILTTLRQCPSTKTRLASDCPLARILLRRTRSAHRRNLRGGHWCDVRLHDPSNLRRLLGVLFPHLLPVVEHRRSLFGDCWWIIRVCFGYLLHRLVHRISRTSFLSILEFRVCTTNIDFPTAGFHDRSVEELGRARRILRLARHELPSPRHLRLQKLVPDSTSRRCIRSVRLSRRSLHCCEWTLPPRVRLSFLPTEMRN